MEVIIATFGKLILLYFIIRLTIAGFNTFIRLMRGGF